MGALTASTSGSAWTGDVVQNCVSGDEQAWRHLYELHHARARRFLFRLGVPDGALDDACQEVFLEVFRYLPGFRQESSFETWLYRLCATQARKARTKSRVQAALRETLGRFARPLMGSGPLEESQVGHQVMTALGQLSDKERIVFVLHELEGQRGKAIAQIIGCPEATVWRRLHHARKSFQQCIEETGGRQ